RARVLYGLGNPAIGQGDYRLERSVGLCRAVGDSRGMVIPLMSLVVRAEIRGDRARTMALAEGCRVLGRAACAAVVRMGPVRERGSLTELGRLAMAAGDLDLAEMRTEEALALSLQAGDLAQQVEILDIQAMIACRRGLLERAAALARKAVELLWTARDTRRYAG